jgi:hypothetical protein
MQFSLRTLFVAVVGIGAALWVAEPSPQVAAIEVVLALWVPTLAVIFGLKTAGNSRVCWLGVAFTLAAFAIAYSRECITLTKEPGLSLLLLAERFVMQFSVDFRGLLAVWAAYGSIVGILCVLAHWLFI